MKHQTFQWDHPKLDVVVQFWTDGDHIEVEHVFGYVYGKQCIAKMFDHDILIDDWQSSSDYDEMMGRKQA